MGLYQPTVITPSSLNGTGVVDATQDMTVSFYINGTIPINGWKFIIMKNDMDSTVLYDSGWRHDYITVEGQQVAVYTYGRDGYGNLVPKTDTISAADLASAGVVNNYTNGYKLRIDQQYSEYVDPNNSGLVEIKTLEQTSPAFFIAMKSASFDTNWITLRGRYVISHFDVAAISMNPYVSHLFLDPLMFGRFRLAFAGNPENNIVVDTGNIYCPQNNTQRQYGILEKGKTYAARATGQLESGTELDTGWYEFTPTWTDTSLDYIHLRAYYVAWQPCICVRFEADDGYDLSSITSAAAYRGWEIHRVRVDTGEVSKVGVIPRGQTEIYDFGARNNTPYIYRAYYGLGTEEGNYYETEHAIQMRQYWNWAIIECEERSAQYYYIPTHPYTNTMYHVVRTHQFQGNVVSGSLSNENKPYVADNFTPYPTVQKSSRTGLSGTLKAWVGRTRNGVFTDSIAEVEKIMALSTRETVKFLKDRKGNLWRIEIKDAIQQTMQDQYAEQPVEIQIPWVEVGDAKEAQIVSLTSDGVMAPGDDIVDTTSSLVRYVGTNELTGDAAWTREEEDYVGSEIGMDENGMLTQTYDDDLSYVPAALSIVDGNLVATTVVDAEG